ncbi:MAG: diacylglycerol kinase [Bosea sp. (in: a-proteobacteria)]
MIAAFFNSLRGFRWALRREAAVREEIIGLSIALPIAALIAPDLASFVMLIGVILALIAVELLNTAIEKLADHITPEHHPQIGIVKDLGSAAVFAMLILAALVWGHGLWRWWAG